MSTPHPAVQQLTNSNPLTPAISSRWGFREKVLDSSLIDNYDGHTNKANEILWKNSPTEIFKIMNLNKSNSHFKTAFEISTILKTKIPHETKNYYSS